MEVTLEACKEARVPEPVRIADALSEYEDLERVDSDTDEDG